MDKDYIFQKYQELWPRATRIPNLLYIIFILLGGGGNIKQAYGGYWGTGGGLGVWIWYNIF